MIAISLVVSYFVGIDPMHQVPTVKQLWFSTDGSYSEILRGEVWRVFSPIFLHFGIMHLVFNMLWTRQFGTQIESRVGTLKFLGIVVFVAASSNWAEFQFGMIKDGLHTFGGMSGVVYGLFGYIWIRGKMEPETGFYLPQQTITMMLVWHVLCMVGVIPQVANWCMASD